MRFRIPAVDFMARKAWNGWAAVAIFFLSLCNLLGADIPPPAPGQFFVDYSKVIPAQVANQLNDQLTQFERDTSNQILVAVFSNLPLGASLDDYCQTVFRAWKPGQKDKNNGAILFVFLKDRKMRIQTGLGLEGALPDITCKRIIADEIAPYFKKSQYGEGLTVGVNSMIAATRGEYKGTGRTKKSAENEQASNTQSVVILIILIAIIFLSRKFRGNSAYGTSSPGWYIGGGHGEGRGSGGRSGGGDDGFSGGGGDSGGGGSSGSW